MPEMVNEANRRSVMRVRTEHLREIPEVVLLTEIEEGQTKRKKKIHNAKKKAGKSKKN